LELQPYVQCTQHAIILSLYVPCASCTIYSIYLFPACQDRFACSSLWNSFAFYTPDMPALL